MFTDREPVQERQSISSVTEKRNELIRERDTLFEHLVYKC